MDNEQKEVEVPTEIILFSTLSKEEKIKYFTKKYADPSSPNNREYDNDWDFSFP